MKRISIITVNYNHPAVTEELLRSIFAENTYPNLEIIVVDNGSSVDPVPEWEKKYPAVQFIRSETNLGFAGGNNLGIAVATGEYLFFINNDTEITKDLLERMANVLDQHPKAGMVSPKILFNGTSRIQYAGYTALNYLTGRNKCIGEFEEDKGQFDHRLSQTAYAHGAAMMVRKEAIEKAGPMAENFFLYYEELEWSERIRRNGFEIWVDTDAVIYHKESMSVGKQSPLKEYYMNRNRMLMVRKHAPVPVYCFFFLYFVSVAAPVAVFRHLKNRQGRLIPALGKAIWWNLTNSAGRNKIYV